MRATVLIILHMFTKHGDVCHKNQRVVSSAFRLYCSIPLTITDICRIYGHFHSYIIVIDLRCPYSRAHSFDIVRLVRKTLSTRVHMTPYEKYTIDRTITNVCTHTNYSLNDDVKSREQPKHRRRAAAESRIASTNCIHTAPITRICVKTSLTVISDK